MLCERHSDAYDHMNTFLFYHGWNWHIGYHQTVFVEFSSQFHGCCPNRWWFFVKVSSLVAIGWSSLCFLVNSWNFDRGEELATFSANSASQHCQGYPSAHTAYSILCLWKLAWYKAIHTYSILWCDLDCFIWCCWLFCVAWGIILNLELQSFVAVFCKNYVWVEVWYACRNHVVSFLELYLHNCSLDWGSWW